jgi:hypothetical protein
VDCFGNEADIHETLLFAVARLLKRLANGIDGSKRLATGATRDG